MMAAFAAAIAACSATGLVGSIGDGGVNDDDASVDATLDGDASHRDATMDVALVGDANLPDVIGDAGRDADAARCRLEGDACVACNCPTLNARRVHLLDSGACQDSDYEFFSCWDGVGGACVLTAAFTGMCRDEEDGSTSEFVLAGGPNGGLDPAVHSCAVPGRALGETCP
jgi:hypothetical protein